MTRRILMSAVVGSITVLSALADDVLKPYTLACEVSGPIAAVRQGVSEALVSKGFEVAGSYSPMSDDALAVICVTHPLLQKHAAEAGGLLGFAAVLRVGLHATDGKVAVAYTTPAYWGNAYYRKSFPDVEADYATLDKALRDGLGGLGEAAFEPFGSEKGLTPKQLKKYHYMMSMPHFDDVVTLEKKSAYAELVKRIEKRVAESKEAAIVYAVKMEKEKMALFGIALTGDKGEKKFLPKIDFATPRATPFLPYEMLVLEDRAVMLHGKYRIALSFPDLSMGTFMKIVSTPGDIADVMRGLVKNK